MCVAVCGAVSGAVSGAILTLSLSPPPLPLSHPRPLIQIDSVWSDRQHESDVRCYVGGIDLSVLGPYNKPFIHPCTPYTPL